MGSIGEDRSPAAGLRKGSGGNAEHPGLGTIGDDRDPAAGAHGATYYGAVDPASTARREAVAGLMTSWMKAKPIDERVESSNSTMSPGVVCLESPAALRRRVRARQAQRLL